MITLSNKNIRISVIEDDHPFYIEYQKGESLEIYHKPSKYGDIEFFVVHNQKTYEVTKQEYKRLEKFLETNVPARRITNAIGELEI